MKPEIRSIIFSRRIALGLGLTAWFAATATHANIIFNLVPDPGTPQFAIDGFTAAANLWSASLADNITVNLQIGFAPLAPNVLGETSSSFDEWSYVEVRAALDSRRNSADDYSSSASLQPGDTFNRLINHTSDNPNGPNSAVPYVDTMNRVGITTANAKALGFLVPTGATDATIRFSSDFPFDFNHGASIDPLKYDFVGAAAHEIGHALGFISGVDDIDAANGQSPGGDFSSNMIDLYRFSAESLAAGPGYTDYTADTRTKYFSVNGGSSLNGSFSTGLVFGDGRQASHWKDFQGIGIMDPSGSPGERLDISFTDLRVFDVMGYTLVPEPGVTALAAVGLLALLGNLCRRRG